MCKSAALKNLFSIFEGEHDFSNFARIENNKNPIRTIDKITIKETKYFYYIDFFAQTYLWHQIRRVISAILQAKKQKITQRNITKALDNPNDKIDFGLVRSEPLILKDVLYDFSFEEEKKYIIEKNKIEKNLINEIKCLSF